jgi:hypothetical protein
LGDKNPKEAFIGVNLEFNHLRIFGCPLYIHVSREKRRKLVPYGKKRNFVGYIDTLKANKIYIPRQRQIEVSLDVTFDEEVSFRKSKESHMEIDSEEKEAPKDGGTDTSGGVSRAIRASGSI